MWLCNVLLRIEAEVRKLIEASSEEKLISIAFKRSLIAMWFAFKCKKLRFNAKGFAFERKEIVFIRYIK